MPTRKATPDVLSEILGGDLNLGSQPKARPQPPGKPARTREATPASKRQTAIAKDVEYRLVSFQDHKGWRLRFVDGQELDDWLAGPLLHDYLASMAGQGWELVTACSGERMFGTSDKYQLYFRRQK